jgi:hypothetical protein
MAFINTEGLGNSKKLNVLLMKRRPLQRPLQRLKKKQPASWKRRQQKQLALQQKKKPRLLLKPTG